MKKSWNKLENQILKKTTKKNLKKFSSNVSKILLKIVKICNENYKISHKKS